VIETSELDLVALPAGASAVRLVVVDMDGTLLNNDAQVSPRALTAIAAAERAGVHFVIATGRRHSYAMKVLRELELTPDNVMITSNGAVVRTVDARLIETTHLPVSTAKWLLEHMSEYRNAMVLTFDRVGADGDDARGALVVEELEDLHRSIGKWMTVNGPYIEFVQPMERALEGDAPIQMMICGTVERMRRAEARLLEDSRVVAVGRPGRAETEVQLARTEYPERDLSIVDILPAGCSKGAAVLRFAASQGVRPEEMMAIGDNWNDLSMLEVVGFPVVMENAPEDFLEVARERGWMVGPRNSEDGVARVVEGVLAGLGRI
jgi:hydroxymethylpyrimidine pyrophosphatase-like HAD family hydrolase